MKVIFMTSNPFIEQQAIDMYVEAIASEYSIELWDLSKIYNRLDKVSDQIEKVMKVNSVNEFENMVNNSLRDDMVVIITNIIIPQLAKLKILFTKKKITIININKEGLAAWLGDSGLAERLHGVPIQSRIKHKLKMNRWIRGVYNKVKFHGIKYDYLLSAYDFYPEQRKRFIRIHNIKYDEYLQAEKELPYVDKPYILFVDAAYVGHPMFSQSNQPLDENYYIGSLNRYFDKLEDTYHMPVIISSHPKAMYSDDTFNGRRIIKYKTPNLIKYANYIISHYSTSLVDAILLGKPMKIMFSQQLLECATRYCVLMGCKFADLLKIDLVDLDNPSNNDFRIDKNAYDNFIYTYVLNSKKMDLNNKEIIMEFMHELESNLSKKFR